jgi:hypothetical protein
MYKLSRSSFLPERPPAVQEVGGSNPSRDMSVSGALVEDGDDLVLVSLYYNILDGTVIIYYRYLFDNKLFSVASKMSR